MPSFDVPEPLAPIACRSDPSAPCFHWHLKLYALNGGRDKLTERELNFVGVDVWLIVTVRPIGPRPEVRVSDQDDFLAYGVVIDEVGAGGGDGRI